MPTAMVARPGPASVSGGVTWRRHCIVSGDFHLDFGDASERLVLARPQFARDRSVRGIGGVILASLVLRADLAGGLDVGRGVAALGERGYILRLGDAQNYRFMFGFRGEIL